MMFPNPFRFALPTLHNERGWGDFKLGEMVTFYTLINPTFGGVYSALIRRATSPRKNE